MARQMPVLHPETYQNKAKHPPSAVRCRPVHLYMPVDYSIAHGKASARAAYRSKPSQGKAHTFSAMPPAASQHASGPNHCCPWQGNCPCCISQHTNAKAMHISSAMPAAASQHASGPKTIAYDKATACAASRSKPIKANHPSNSMPPAASQHASGPKHCPWQGKCSCCILPHTNSRQKHTNSAMPTAASQHASGPKHCPW
jgi:hypothetical protein